MFDAITNSIAYLRSKAIEWYEWFQQSEAPTVSEEPIAPAADTPVVVKPHSTPAQLPSISPTPRPSQSRDANKVKKGTPVVQQQLRKTDRGTPYKRDEARRTPKIALNTFSTRGKNLEHLIGQTREQVRRHFFTGQIVGFTGRLPHDPADIETLIRRLGGIPGFDGMWQAEQLLIIGREGFDPMYLKHSVQVGMQHSFECHYISQEALTGLLQFGTLPGYYHGDARIREHDGLHCVANFGFVWPTTDVSGQLSGASAEKPEEWRTQHELVSVYGYRVDARTGLTLAQRQDRLHCAVVALGLRCVAEHIAANIQLAKNRRNANMESAIDKWESDLDWLHDRFYKSSIHAFVWPRVYRRRRKAI